MMTSDIISDAKKNKVKVSFQHAYFYKSKFQQSSCALGISVGQPAHEGDKFAATINTVNNNFRECMIMVCDSLQRYSISAHTDKSIAELHNQANILGEQWVARNKKIIDKLTIPHEIIRWDSWLHHPLFADAQKKINDLYLHDSVFKKALYDAAEDFAVRAQRRFLGDHCGYNKVFDASTLYLKEECAVILLWAAEENIDFEIYPGSRVKAMEYVYKKLILPEYGETLYPLSIRLRKK